MIEFNGAAVLLDVEGTTSSVNYIVGVLLPFARRELYRFLRMHWNEPDVQAILQQVARDEGAESFEDWVGGPGLPPEFVFLQLREHLVRLMEADAKTAGLKMLQELIWKGGFADGLLKAHVYEEVPQALKTWTQAGKRVAAFSCESVAAQSLLFTYSDEGDLTAHLAGFFDATIGSKCDARSYLKIADRLRTPPEQILFLSDVEMELDAARSAGLQTALVVRPDGDPCPAAPRHPVIESFEQVACR
jgi:enolase-phosphatase E1